LKSFCWRCFGHSKCYDCDGPRDLKNNPLKNQAHVKQILGSGSNEVQNLSLSVNIDVLNELSGVSHQLSANTFLADG